MKSEWSPGDWAVYRKSKRSTSPGPRAASVVASPKGEEYTYVVDKFWVVQELLPEHRLLLRTAKGKTHQIAADDPNLRRPSWLQRLLWKSRFQLVEEGFEVDQDGKPVHPGAHHSANERRAAI